MGCCNEKQPCTGKKIYDVCVQYHGEILDWKLKDEENSCNNVQEVIEDIVDYLEKGVKDTSELGKSCIKYEKNKEGRITQKSINESFEENICNLLNTTVNDTTGGLDIRNCNLKYDGLIVDECFKPSNTCEFFQFILDQLKEIKNGKM